MSQPAGNSIRGLSGHIFALGQSGVPTNAFEKQAKGSPYRAEYEEMRQAMPREYRNNDALVDAAIERYFSNPHSIKGIVQQTHALMDAAEQTVQQHKQDLAAKESAVTAKLNEEQIAAPAAKVIYNEQAIIRSIVTQNQRASQMVEANYDLRNGTGAYQQKTAKDEAAALALNKRITGAQDRFDKQVACAVLLPTVIASGITLLPFAVAAGSDYLIAKTGAAGVTALGVKAGIGGSVGLAYSEGVSRGFTGQRLTTGQRIGAFAFSAMFAPGVVEVKWFTAPVNGALNGAASSGGGNAVGQVIDISKSTRKDFKIVELGVSTAIGTIAGTVGGTVKPYYANAPSLGSSQSIVAGAKTGLRETMHAAPQTVVSYVTQAHLDLANAIYGSSKSNISPATPATAVPKGK